MSQPKTVYRKDYQAPAYWIDSVELLFDLHQDHTEVTSTLTFRKNTDVSDTTLTLFGVDLELKSIELDQSPLPAAQYSIESEKLKLQELPASGQLKIVTHIKPHENTSLEGLYVSNDMYCTQCEAEGFRKITYYPDRPDVMAAFRVKIIADQDQYPVLLSNGNRMAEGQLDNGRHWVEWEDPFKKPSYLFALVAGDLVCVEDTFTTMSGREVALQIFVEAHDKDKVDFAMASLKASMTWDEQTYGREYDLDIYMIVAVSHFNMGAMENKGLNIFNTSCVLAHPKTTTDAGFERVEAVIAHEYFHNWSGNRVTCRDWFQLSLKEGFTVFRDQSFSADLRSAAIKRVEDVNYFRTHQYAEDAGPMAHPVRPDSYIEINNFYTLTVYEKGAEVVRMLRNLLGETGFRQGSDLYFERFDGQAVTCDDFVQAMFEANPNAMDDAEQVAFKRWYSQAGTPEVSVETQYDQSTQSLSITLSQDITENPNVSLNEPVLIPVRLGLLDTSGKVMTFDFPAKSLQAVAEVVLPFTQQQQTFELTGVQEVPVVSWLRGFSAPIKLQVNRSKADWAFLMAHDTDSFARWEAANQLYVTELMEHVERIHVECINAESNAQPSALAFSGDLMKAYEKVLLQDFDDLAEKAQMLALPSETYLAGLKTPVLIDEIVLVRNQLMKTLAETFESQWLALYNACQSSEAYQPSTEQIAQRSLKNTALKFLSLTGSKEALSLCLDQFNKADNMTDQRAALTCLVHSEWAEKDEVIESFYQQWQHEALVVDQWLMVQATNPEGDALQAVKQLLAHPAFDMKSPNKVRSLIGAFAGSNLKHFHRPDGAGYEFLADRILELNKLNPSIAARLVTPLTRWKRQTEDRQALMKQQLERIAATEGLSPDVFEIVSKSLKA